MLFVAAILAVVIVGSVAICYAIGAEHEDVIRALYTEDYE